MGRWRNAKGSTRQAWVALGLAVGGGCAPISPPPLFARHHGAGADPEGAVVVTLAAGIGGADLGGGFGVELRASWQATEAVAVGVGLGGAMGGDPVPARDPTRDDEDDDEEGLAPATRLFALRLFGRATPPAADWVAATFGAGVSLTDGGLFALTLDAGGVVSGTIAGTVEPSLGVAAALSLPLTQGRGLLSGGEVKLPASTVYLGGSLGLAIHLGDTENVVSTELGAWRALARGGAGASVYALSLADAQGFIPEEQP
jgi:hypothetical protein